MKATEGGVGSMRALAVATVFACIVLSVRFGLSRRVADQAAESAVEDRQSVASALPVVAPAARSAPSPVRGQTGADTVLCGNADVLEFEPTNISSQSVTKTNPFTGKPVTFQPKVLTEAQQVIVRVEIAKLATRQVRDDCLRLDLAGEPEVQLSGAPTSCRSGCNLANRRLTVGIARWAFSFAKATSMTIGGFDRVFIPEGVTSEHRGEPYARVVRDGDELFAAFDLAR